MPLLASIPLRKCSVEWIGIRRRSPCLEPNGVHVLRVEIFTHAADLPITDYHHEMVFLILYPSVLQRSVRLDFHSNVVFFGDHPRDSHLDAARHLTDHAME